MNLQVDKICWDRSAQDPWHPGNMAWRKFITGGRDMARLIFWAEDIYVMGKK